MPIAPVHRLKKAEIVKLASKRCKHGHVYLNHYACWLQDNPEQKERIGALDIEASSLDADWGQMLTWCIRDLETGDVVYDVLTKADIAKAKNGDEDRRIVESCIAEIGEYDRLITFYGARYDVPFIRARALIVGADFPYPHGVIKHKDVYDIIKSKFKLASRRQENACRQLLGDTKKTRIDTRFWRNAVRGDEESLRYVLEHNIADVEDLCRLYLKVRDYVKVNDTSI